MPERDSRQNLGYQPALDGVRGISILLVLIHHTEFIKPISFSVLPGGFLGVDIFFVLSGFLITSLLVEELETTGTISFRRFYIRRALRLLPAVGAALLFSALVGAVIGFDELGLTAWRVVSIIGYFTNWVRAYETPDLWFLTHFWSLAIEEQFYLVWPFAFFGLLRAGIGRRGVLLIVTAGIVISVIWMAVLQSRGATVLRLLTGSDTRAHTLLVGCWLSLAWHWGYLKAESWNSRSYQILISLTMILLTLVCIFVRPGSRFLYAGGSLVVALCAGILIVSLVVRGNRLFFTNPVMLWLGRRSYGLYVWHWPCFYLCAYIKRPSVAIPAAVLAALAAAAVSYKFIELPFLRMKARFAASDLTTTKGTKSANQ